MKLIDILFSDFEFYRKWKGGKWEYWTMEGPVWCEWFQVKEFTGIYNKRPHESCRGSPICEDWTKKEKE